MAQNVQLKPVCCAVEVQALVPTGPSWSDGLLVQSWGQQLALSIVVALTKLLGQLRD